MLYGHKEPQKKDDQIIEKGKQERGPAAREGLAVVQKTAYDLIQQELACLEGYCDLVAALVEAAAKTSPSGQVQFQFFHETAPEKGIAPF